MAASLSWFCFEPRRIGINLRRFSSMAAQINSQLELDRAIRVLKIKVEDAIKILGLRIIRVRRSWTPKQKLEAFG